MFDSSSPFSAYQSSCFYLDDVTAALASVLRKLIYLFWLSTENREAFGSVPAAAVFGRTHQHLFFSIHLEHPQAIVARDLTKCRCVNIFVYAFRVKIYAISWTTIATLISIADRDIFVSVEIEVVKIYC